MVLCLTSIPTHGRSQEGDYLPPKEQEEPIAESSLQRGLVEEGYVQPSQALTKVSLGRQCMIHILESLLSMLFLCICRRLLQLVGPLWGLGFNEYMDLLSTESDLSKDEKDRLGLLMCFYLLFPYVLSGYLPLRALIRRILGVRMVQTKKICYSDLYFFVRNMLVIIICFKHKRIKAFFLALMLNSISSLFFFYLSASFFVYTPPYLQVPQEESDLKDALP